MSVKKQMFRVGKCALDLTFSFRRFDLTGEGCDPTVKSGVLDEIEFERALGAVGIFMSKAEIAALARAFGDERGRIQYEILGESLREGMNDRRTNLVRKIYLKIDMLLPHSVEADPATGKLTDNKAPMTMDFLLAHYHGCMHPMVRAKELTAEECLRQMRDGLENGPMDADGDGCVDEDEFVQFYNDISAGIPSDDYFCYVAECVWDVEENPNASLINGFRQERPRLMPAARHAMAAAHDRYLQENAVTAE